MDIRTIQIALNTRIQCARESGNCTEESLLMALLQMSEEYKVLKSKDIDSED